MAGWVLSERQLRHTDDDGATWRTVDLAPLGRPSAWAFVDATTAVVAVSGTGGTIIARTTDGGATVQSTTVPNTGGPTRPSMSFVDRTHGYLTLSTLPEGDARTATVRSSLYRSDDSGATWTLVSASSPVGQVTFRSTLLGAGSGTGANGSLHVTNDGGVTWRRLRPPGWDGEGPAGGPNYSVLWQDDDRLIVESVLATGMMVDLAFLETHDGGAHWRRIDLADDATPYSGTGPKPQLAVLDPPRLALLLPTRIGVTLDGGYAYRTSDDLGRTWTKVAPTPCQNSPALRAASSTRIWILSQPTICMPDPEPRPAAITRTTDGRNWTTVTIAP